MGKCFVYHNMKTTCFKVLYFKKSLCHTWKLSSGNQFSTVFTQIRLLTVVAAIM